MYDELSNCSICGRAVGKESVIAFDYLGITHADFGTLDDAVVHEACLHSWPPREQFIAFWNEQLRAAGLPRRLRPTASGGAEYVEASWLSEALSRLLRVLGIRRSPP
jgi:hypothetical protein